MNYSAKEKAFLHKLKSMKKSIDIEIYISVSISFKANVILNVTFDEGTEGALIGSSVEFNGVDSFIMYSMCGEKGNTITKESSAYKYMHGSIEQYCLDNWVNICKDNNNFKD